MICGTNLTHKVASCIPFEHWMHPTLEDVGLEVIRAGPVHKIAELDFGGPLHSLVLTLDVFFGQ